MKEKKEKKSKPKLNPLIPIKLEDIGDVNNDPCFGRGYDLSTDECKQCGDSELCAIKFAAELGKTRKQLEQENNYKDLEPLIDTKAVFKTIRALKRKDLKMSEILDRVQAKYELSREEAKSLYKQWKEKHNGNNSN